MTTRRASILAFILALVVASLVLAPLGLALRLAPSAGLAAAAARGSVWSGQLDAVWLGALQLGDLDVKLSPLSGISGRGWVRIRPVRPNDGEIGLDFTRRGLRVRSGRLEFPLERLTGGQSPLRGWVRFAEPRISLFQGRCREASGVAQVSDIRLAAGAGALEGLVLRGPLRCDRGAMRLLLSGASPSLSMDAELRMPGDGGYRMTLQVRPLTPEMDAFLGLAGFERIEGGFRRIYSGRLGGAAG